MFKIDKDNNLNTIKKRNQVRAKWSVLTIICLL